MIAVIIGIVMVVMGILLLIFGIKDDMDDLVGFGVGVLLAVILVITLPLLCGKSIYKTDTTKLLTEKENIEYLLETKPSLYAIKEAETYNSNIEFGNNYFCRFSKEDRSEFKINIDKYISGENND